MTEDLDKILCVHYKASRNVEENERKDSKYEQMGCYDCDGNKKDCDNNTPLGEVMYEFDEE